jgi:hypothetical protein
MLYVGHAGFQRGVAFGAARLHKFEIRSSKSAVTRVKERPGFPTNSNVRMPERSASFPWTSRGNPLICAPYV